MKTRVWIEPGLSATPKWRCGKQWAFVPQIPAGSTVLGAGEQPRAGNRPWSPGLAIQGEGRQHEANKTRAANSGDGRRAGGVRPRPGPRPSGPQGRGAANGGKAAAGRHRPEPHGGNAGFG